MVTLKRQKEHTWKLQILELGPIPVGNLSHKPISQLLCSHTKRIAIIAGENYQTEDIPTHILCDNKIGLIYLLSKYGSFYICDLETGVPLYYELVDCIDGCALFSIAFDPATDSLIAVSRSGQVLLIQVSLSLLIHERSNPKVAPKVWERINCKLQEVKGINVEDISESNHHQSHYLSVNSYDSQSTSNSSESTSLSNKPVTYHFGQTLPNGEYSSLDSLTQSSNAVVNRKQSFNSATKFTIVLPEPIFHRENNEEQITRL